MSRRYKQIIIAVLALILIILLGIRVRRSLRGPALLSGNTYYVSMSGSDSNTCNTTDGAGTNKRHIANGIGCLSAGDTLVIHTGTYDEQIANIIPSGVNAGTPTVIKNAPGELVTITKTGACNTGGQGSLVEQGNRSYIKWFGDGTTYTPGNTTGTWKFVLDANSLCGVVVDADEDPGANTGFTFDGIEFKNALASGMFLGGDGHLVTNSYVHHNGSIGVGGDDHGIYHGAHNSVFEKNLLTNDVSGYGIQQQTNAAATAVNNIYRRNTCKNNYDACMLFSNGDNTLVYNNISINDGNATAGHGGFRANEGITNTQFLNNTVYGCLGLGGGNGIIMESTSASNTARNNIVRNCSGNPVKDSASGSVCSNNTWSATNCTGTANPDPLFMNAAGDNFHIQNTSTAVKDLGMTLATVTTDMDSVTRPQGSAYDIGAYEYTTGGGSVGLEILRGSLINATSTTITFASVASALNDYYSRSGTSVAVLDGTGGEQFRHIIGYNGATQIATVSPAWVTIPTGGSTYVVIPTAGGLVIRTGIATAGGSNTITLESGAKSTDGWYSRAGTGILITGGTGIGQVRTIINYTGSTRLATVDVPWVTVPDNTSMYSMFPR